MTGYVDWGESASLGTATRTLSGVSMDLQAVLSEIDSWPIEDRIRLVQEVWDRLGDRGHGSELPEPMKQEIDRRLAAHAANPLAAIPWEQVEADALARLRR